MVKDLRCENGYTLIEQSVFLGTDNSVEADQCKARLIPRLNFQLSVYEGALCFAGLNLKL